MEALKELANNGIWSLLTVVFVFIVLCIMIKNWKVNSNYLIPCYVENSNVACACMINIAEGTVNSYTPLPATKELRFCGEIYVD